MLKKYKIEKLFQENPKSFIIIELLPIKEINLVQLVQKFNKIGFEAKSLKTKTTGGVFNSFQKTGSLCESPCKNIFKGNLMLIYPKEFKAFETLNTYVTTTEKKDFIILSVYHKGLFYHANTFFKSITTYKNANLIATINQNSQSTITVLQNPIITLIRVLNLSFKS